jgi:pimeloyl-ACP methyl ester carboxylesterase
MNPAAHLDRIVLQPQSTLPYYHNYSPGDDPPTLAVVVVHGINRNAHDYFRSIVRAAVDLGVIAQTLIIAPHFQIEHDSWEACDAYWTDSGRTSWKDGGGAVHPPGLSSFQAMDEVLTILADKNRFPMLSRATLVGHSAGGQFVHRYAAAGRAPRALAGLSLSYVTANPSSYLYLNTYRPVASSQLELCLEYNDYKYGLDNRNGYLSVLSDEQIRQQYTSCRVTYLLGRADIRQGRDLEINCAANAQGANRFQRGSYYYSFIKSFFPSARHNMVVVPGVGHDYDATFNSVPGKTVIFAHG